MSNAEKSSSESSSSKRSLMMSAKAKRLEFIGGLLGRGFLFTVTSLSLISVLFIFYFIGKDSIPFFFTVYEEYKDEGYKKAQQKVKMVDATIDKIIDLKEDKPDADADIMRSVLTSVQNLNITNDVKFSGIVKTLEEMSAMDREQRLGEALKRLDMKDELLMAEPAELTSIITRHVKPTMEWLKQEHIEVQMAKTNKHFVIGRNIKKALGMIASQDNIALNMEILTKPTYAIEYPVIAPRTYELLTSTRWYPSRDPPEYGTLAIFYGTFLVMLGAIIVAVPIGVSAAVCMSDILPFSVRQIVKPVIEILAAIPSVAFGFFALVVFAPVLQDHGGPLLAVIFLLLLLPVLIVVTVVMSDFLSQNVKDAAARINRRTIHYCIWGGLFVLFLIWGGRILWMVKIDSGTNALNVAFILGMMALPTIVSVSEDALQAAGRELREGSYALGATRAETMIKTVIPASLSGIIAAIILGIMRVIGETMVVWMASGNTAQIPSPPWTFFKPVRTLTASIAGDMGEAARGTPRYHVLFVMALALLIISFIMNLASQWVVNIQRKKLGK